MSSKSILTIGNFRQGARIYAGTQDITSLVERYNIKLSVYGDSSASLNIVYDYNVVKMVENPSDTTHIFSYGTKIAIYIEHPFAPGKYLQAFYGEVSGASISRSKYRSETGIAVSCTGFLHHIAKVNFPYGISAVGSNVDIFNIAVSTGASAFALSSSAVDMYTESEELHQFIMNLIEGSSTKLSDLINIVLMGANSFHAVTNVKSYSIVKDRFLYVVDAEFPSTLQKQLQNLLKNKVHLKNLGEVIKTITSYLLCEIFTDSNGSFVVKPPCWNFGIPRSHFIHPMLVQTVHTSEINHLKYTRVMIRSHPVTLGSDSEGMSVQGKFITVYKEDTTCSHFNFAGNNIISSEDMDSIASNDMSYETFMKSLESGSSSEVLAEFSALEPSDYESKYGISLLNPNPLFYPITELEDAEKYQKEVILPYGKYMLASANKEASTGSIQLACCAPWLRVGFNCMILPFNKVYYIAALSHSGTPGGRCNTTISGNYGTSFEALQEANKSDIHHFVTPSGYDSLTIPNYTDSLVIDAIPEDYKTW